MSWAAVALAAVAAAGVPDATGHVLRIVWDPAANLVTDLGVGDNEPDTGLLGAGVPLDLGG